MLELSLQGPLFVGKCAVKKGTIQVRRKPHNSMSLNKPLSLSKTIQYSSSALLNHNAHNNKWNFLSGTRFIKS